MSRPCTCDRPDCLRCHLFRTNWAVNRLWGGDGIVPAPASSTGPPGLPDSGPLPCAHQGAPAPPPDGRDARKSWLLCEAGLGVVCRCDCGPACSRYEPDAPDRFGPVGARHLVYHVLPVRGNGVWRRGIDQLRLRWGLFTGRKVVAVATGTAGSLPLDAPSEVREYLPPGCEVVEVPNDPNLREVTTWVPLWERVLDTAADDDAVLYAHAKGVTRNVDPGNSCQWWASLLYSLHLDHWPLVAAHLTRFPVTGAFKKVGHGFARSRSAWHYSGTFFWVRGGDFRSRPWQTTDPRWWGTEAWPGLAYRPAEAGCLFLEGTVGSLDLYSPELWGALVRPRYAEWLSRNPPSFPWAESPRAPARCPSPAA